MWPVERNSLQCCCHVTSEVMWRNVLLWVMVIVASLDSQREKKGYVYCECNYESVKDFKLLLGGGRGEDRKIERARFVFVLQELVASMVCVLQVWEKDDDGMWHCTANLKVNSVFLCIVTVYCILVFTVHAGCNLNLSVWAWNSPVGGIKVITTSETPFSIFRNEYCLNKTYLNCSVHD